MIENISLAFQGIWGHKLRSFLTMLGIIIGIAAIMTIVSTIQGTNEQIKQNLIGSGTDAVKIELYQGATTSCSAPGATDHCHHSSYTRRHIVINVSPRCFSDRYNPWQHHTLPNRRRRPRITPAAPSAS